ncbi:MAG: ADP-glyceromanno-heptose 6-epimerase [Bacteroidetes bacterium]|nr:ADP-glyceromanno-heptose 6-epimerase [Bacteroidota bacterium]
MNNDKLIVVTGAAGFIGSCLVKKLNIENHTNLVLVDDFEALQKAPNLIGKNYSLKVERKNFHNWLKEYGKNISFIFHIGARTDTTETNKSIFDELNYLFSQKTFQFATENSIPILYASSAATYGNGENGYDDDHKLIYNLKPMNPYGDSKNEFDKWVLSQNKFPPFWCGLKFFNVYGPNESHKKRMASVVLHSFDQIKNFGKVKLFRSHNPNYKDGEQKRDFIYVKDLIDICYYFYKTQNKNGIYNLGTGKARTFLDLVNLIFKAIDKKPEIEFIDTPLDIRDTYQYFTEAVVTKLRSAGYTNNFTPIEDGVTDYIKNYLITKKYY